MIAYLKGLRVKKFQSSDYFQGCGKGWGAVYIILSMEVIIGVI